MQKILIMITICWLTACSGLHFPGVYKVPVEQGNIITQEMIDQLKPGMSTSQVEYIMGSPLLKDSFNGSRWDYLYSVKRGDSPRQQHRLSIFFDQEGMLSHFTGDFRPSSQQAQHTETEEPAQ